MIILKSILNGLLSVITGPITKMTEAYISYQENTAMAKIEREVQRDFLTAEIRKAMLEDGSKGRELAAAILRRDRGDRLTSWIRPTTAAMALLFWALLALSQMVWGGNGILPIVWNVPPGLLGQVFLGFPMGILATFYVARPFEKFLIGKTRV